jgi:Flp pilus assembly pilin Flp
MDFFYLSSSFGPLSRPQDTTFNTFRNEKYGISPAICPYNHRGHQMLKLKKFAKLTKNQKGQGVMEYVIISSLVGIVCITAVKGFGDVINKRVEMMKESIVKNIKT